MTIEEKKRQLQLLSLQTIKIIELVETALDRKDMLPPSDLFNYKDYERVLTTMKQVQERTKFLFFDFVQRNP